MKVAYLTLVLGAISYLRSVSLNVMTLDLLYISAARELPKRIQLQPIDGKAARPMQGLIPWDPHGND